MYGSAVVSVEELPFDLAVLADGDEARHNTLQGTVVDKAV